MPISIAELAYQIGSDTTSGVDGCSNQDRTSYVCEVMGVDGIDLNEHIDYSMALTNDCPEFVQASIHLLKLQMQYLKAVFYAGYIDKDTYELKSAWFDLWCRKLQWHVDHLNRDEVTPPFTFLH